MLNLIQIIMTPTRNEAWVLRAFLECNSLWADYIIIADQKSTDGTREIISEYQKKWEKSHQCQLIMIDNTNPEFNEPERQALLVAKAREVAKGRDTLLWGLDADEILPANWQETEDGKHILNSETGDVFWFKWANLSPDKEHYGDAIYQPWLFHDDGVEPHGNYVRNMHSMRIPYPKDEKQMYYVKDFRVLHCGFLNPQRTIAKSRFYKFVDWERNKTNVIKLERLYGGHDYADVAFDTPYKLDTKSIAYPFDLWSHILMKSKQTWFDDYVYERIGRYSVNQMRKLYIWDKDFIENYKITDPRRPIDKLMHWYLRKTNKWQKALPIRAIDKMLKILY